MTWEGAGILPGTEFDKTEPTYYHEPMTNPNAPVQTTTPRRHHAIPNHQSPIDNLQSPIINSTQSDRMRPNPTEIRACARSVYSRTHEELAQKRGHGAPRAPSHVIPAKAGIQHSPIDNQQSAINNSPPPTSFPTPSTSFPHTPTSFPRRRESGGMGATRIHWRSVGVDRAERAQVGT